ncbi:MAG: uncharacterized membrane protein (UPF0127 family) [Bradyrhizobium sp.]|jgi:uncharacterized membrane protein (UPF0127 family)
MNIIKIAGVPGLRITVAKTFWQRLIGLLGKRRLAYDSALLLVPCNNIHTAFMCFAIDVVFIDLTGTVVAIYPRVRPFEMVVEPAAYGCLELCAGAAAHYGLQVGQRLAAPEMARSQDALRQSGEEQCIVQRK